MGMAAVAAVVNPDDGTEKERVAEQRRAAGLLSPEAYDAVVVDMVMFAAPNMFALVEQEVNDPEIAQVVGFGMAFDGWVEVVSIDGKARGQYATPQEALKPYISSEDVQGRIVWVTPDLVLQKLLTK
ncbi:hypothetical protein GCM10009660_19440 [Catellatospora bangladeshensis]